MALTARERKAAQTAREQEALARLGGRRLKIIAYGATIAALEAVCAREGFTGRQRIAEAITWLAHEDEKRHSVSTHEKEKLKC